MSQNNSTGVYRRLLRYVWPHKGIFLLSVLGFAMFASSAPLMAQLMGEIQKTLVDPTDENIWFVLTALFLVFLYRGTGTFLGKYFTARVGREVVHALRTQLFGHMQHLPSTYYENESSGRQISRVIFDIDQVNGASTRAVTTLVQEGLTVVLLMGYLIWLDYTLTAIFLLIVPAVGALVSLASKFFRKYSRRIQATVGEVTQVTSESITGYREVRTYQATEQEKVRFFRASDNNRRQVMKFELTNAINVPLSQQVIALGLGVMIYLMLQRVAAGSMSAEAFMQFITAAALIAKPLRALTDVNAIIQKGVTAAESVFDVLDTPAEVDSGTQQLHNCRGKVSFDHVSFRYPGVEQDTISGLSLEVAPGETVAFVGRSGSGKSTLVNLLPRFYEMSAGALRIDGHDVRDLTLDSLREQIAIVSQQVTLFNSSIRDNIAYGGLSYATDEMVMAAAKAAHAHEFIEALPEGYATLAGENGVALSGGQRQRIAIARAILKNAPILILDEATSALDSESERHIQAALEEVMKNRTTFVIAHRLSTIESADKIVVIDQGQIVEQGNHADLIEHDGAYAQLHRMQFSEGAGF